MKIVTEENIQSSKLVNIVDLKIGPVYRWISGRKGPCKGDSFVMRIWADGGYYRIVDLANPLQTWSSRCSPRPAPTCPSWESRQMFVEVEAELTVYGDI